MKSHTPSKSLNKYFSYYPTPSIGKQLPEQAVVLNNKYDKNPQDEEVLST